MCAQAKGDPPSRDGCEAPDGAAYLRGGELHYWINTDRLTGDEADQAKATFVDVARKAGPRGGLPTR